MTIFKISVAVFSLLFSLQSRAQTAFYDVIVGGRIIGSVKVLYYDNKAESSKRRIEAEFNIPFYSGSFFSENHFVNGLLKTSVTEHRTNGKQKEKTLTSNTIAQQYQIDFSGSTAVTEKTKNLRFGIEKTITSLYYEEPVDVNTIYSERYGQMCIIKKLKENNYGVTLPNGKKSTYTYRNGQCSAVEAELAGVKLHIVRRENRLAER